MEIKHLSAEEMEAEKRQYPGSEPAEWGLLDEDIYLSFYDTEEAAKAALEKWSVATMVEEAFRAWAHKTAEEIGVDLAKVLEIIKGSV